MKNEKKNYQIDPEDLKLLFEGIPLYRKEEDDMFHPHVDIPKETINKYPEGIVLYVNGKYIVPYKQRK